MAQFKPAVVKAGVEALDTFVALDQACNPYPWSPQQIADHLSHRLNQGFIAYVDTRPVGYLLTQTIGEQGEIFLVGVSPSARRMGVAQLLVSEYLTQVSECLLEVRESNEAAIALYRRMGFEQMGIRKDYYPTQTGREAAQLFSYN